MTPTEKRKNLENLWSITRG